MNDPATIFVEKQKEFLNFLRTRINIFHESNVFFRDLHYGVMGFLQINGLPNRYSLAEDLTWEVIAAYERAKVLIRIDERSWMVNYPMFKKPPVKAAMPAKPVAPAVRPVTPTATAAPTPAQQNAIASQTVVSSETTG
jgi:hypothetical protein